MRRIFRCAACGWQTPKWVGRCGDCHAWDVVEESAPPGRAEVRAAARPITDIHATATTATSCGIGELDRVLGAGLVPGAALLLAGEPGVGKSTLLLAVAGRWAAAGSRTLYVSAEESAAQVRMRAERTGSVHPQLYLAAETDLSGLVAHVDQVRPSLLVVDSVQAVATTDAEGTAGGVTQVREVAGRLVRLGKQRQLPVLMVGHVTKDGGIAGPRSLEHLVDVVLQFEGDRASRLRFVRALKNRYGPVDEVGCFDLSADGIIEVTDPTELFVSRHSEPIAGTCVSVAMEGRRPLLAEVQALVAPTAAPVPRRTTHGLDPGRTAMVLAVLQRRVRLGLATADVYLATVGGARVAEPAADLAVAIATASAGSDAVVPTDLVALGEVGLAGEVRRVAALRARLAEAARLGFRTALVPAAGTTEGTRRPPAADGLRVVPVPDVSTALRVLGLAPGPATARVRPNHGQPRSARLRVVPGQVATP